MKDGGEPDNSHTTENFQRIIPRAVQSACTTACNDSWRTIFCVST